MPPAPCLFSEGRGLFSDSHAGTRLSRPGHPCGAIANQPTSQGSLNPWAGADYLWPGG